MAQGVGRHVGDEASLTLCFVLFFTMVLNGVLTMVSNGVDTLRLPCSALNVKVVENKRG